ncbi:hypothetical protein JZ751_016264 [Albula glossodonta]|uniref:Uncharacterized protein n=1 Tax=Albula glossodonta TaxID=121402 RepID=A0A8T2N2A3_9TELE|nr:hypothetical protein JZ751_016264 [Albula glossodonta]
MEEKERRELKSLQLNYNRDLMEEKIYEILKLSNLLLQSLQVSFSPTHCSHLLISDQLFHLRAPSLNGVDQLIGQRLPNSCNLTSSSAAPPPPPSQINTQHRETLDKTFGWTIGGRAADESSYRCQHLEPGSCQISVVLEQGLQLLWFTDRLHTLLQDRGGSPEPGHRLREKHRITPGVQVWPSTGVLSLYLSEVWYRQQLLQSGEELPQDNLQSCSHSELGPLSVTQQLWDSLHHQRHKLLQFPIMHHVLLLHHLPHGCRDELKGGNQQVQGGKQEKWI